MTGEFIVAELGNNTYQSENFLVVEINENITVISGTLTSETTTDKNFSVKFDSTSIGVGNSTISVNGNVATTVSILFLFSYFFSKNI